jgi:hypothetical protein
VKYYYKPQSGYLSHESEQAVAAAARLCALIGREKYDEWLDASGLRSDIVDGPPDYKLLRDAANAEYVRLTECTCTERDELACPACVFATEKQLVADDGFPY